jgi:hypothetical protein
MRPSKSLPRQLQRTKTTLLSMFTQWRVGQYLTMKLMSSDFSFTHFFSYMTYFNGLEFPYLFQEEWKDIQLLCGAGLSHHGLSLNLVILP